MPFQHDVFISYSSADRPWAARLASLLKARGLRVFFDKESLRAGKSWRDQLLPALRDSRHLVCLWSASAHASDWVREELLRFLMMTEDPAAQERVAVIVRMDAQDNIYGHLQQIAEPALQQAFAAGPDALAEADWLALVARIENAVRHDGDLLAIPVALLTLTDARVQQLSDADVARAAMRLGLAASDIRQGRYGPGLLDWRPFGTALSIQTMMEQVRTALSERLAPRAVRWTLPDDAFWNEDDGDPARHFAAAMRKKRLGAIVIDPVALVDSMVLQRLGMFANVLQDETIAVIVVPPAPASPQTTAFRRWVRDAAEAIVKPYFEPPLEPAMPLRARWGIGLDDSAELLRMVQGSVGHFLHAGRSDNQPATPYTGY